jgi:actin-like ATPase involved in cell morphogenesis
VTAEPAGQAAAPVVHGIDFGTCTSMIMVGRSGVDPVLIRDPLAEYGALGFATSVCARREGSLAVGIEAERMKLIRIQDYRTGFKLEIGQPVKHRLGSADYSPDGLMAEVIGFLRERALAEVPAEPELVVATVPVAWEEWTRDLTVRACVTAGYDPARVRLETEPVAALASLGQIPGRTVVYDLGGGTFDCVVALDAGEGPRIFSAPFGLPQVGGRAFDDRVLRHVRDTFPQAAKAFAAATEVTDDVLRQRVQLREKCTEAKVALSFRPDHETLLSALDPPETLELERSALDRLIHDLVEQTVDECERMLRSVDLSWPDIDRCVLIGGSSRVPLVRQRMQERSGRLVTVPPEPELAVVRGATALALDLVRPAAPPPPPPPPPPEPAPAPRKSRGDREAGQQLDPGLDPDSGANRIVLQKLARGAGHILADRVRRQLAEGAARLSADGLRVVFGGHFGSGKSSVINMLIRQQLLPTSNYPETGVPCFIGAGAADSIRVVAGSQKRSVPFGTASIAAAASLIGADGDYRTEVRKITRLDVTLAASPIPAGTVWVDSPGINDTAEMTARATAVANDADVLIWLVTSRQPISGAEQAVLRDHIAAHGPASVVFIVNAFLDADTPECWQSFLNDEAAAHATRIEQAIDTGSVPKRIVFASARAAAADPEGFGGPPTRALLAEMTGLGYWRAAATRSYQVKAGLTRLGADLARQVSEEETRLTAKRGKQAKAAGTLARQHEDFLEAVGSQVRNVLARQRDAADGAVRAATDMVDGTARTVNFYGQDLTSRLQVIADTTTADITAAIAGQARKYGQAEPAATAQRELAVLLTPPPITIVAGRSASFGKSVAVGAGTGLAAGTVVPVLGHAVGLIGGAVVGGFRAKAVREQQISALRTEVRQAGDAAVTAMCGSADAIVALVKRAYPRPAAPSEPDQSRLTCLREVREHLSRLAAALPDAAAPAAPTPRPASRRTSRPGSQ